MAKEPKKVEGAASEASDPAAAAASGAQVADTGSPEVTVKASLPRRYRIGRAFGTEPVTIAAGELTREDFETVMADPYLAVTVVGVKADKKVD